MDRKTAIIFSAILVVVIVLLASNTFFAVEFFAAKKQMDTYVVKNSTNSQIVAFDRLFVEIVLQNQGQGQVSYEDVLKLENAAANTKDQQIVDQWHAFLNSSTEAEAQAATRSLLTMFADKIYSN